MRLYVIRHGEYDSDHLSVQGKAQAERMSHELEGQFSKVVHSTELRAVETAEIIASGYPVEMVPEEAVSIWNHALNDGEKRRLRKVVDEMVRNGVVTLIVTHQPVLNAIQDIYELEEICDDYCCGACLEVEDGRLELLYHLVPDDY
jgi:broad specificity phosphatase PhoE